MKTARIITILITVVLVFSTWTPSTVYARQADSPVSIAPSSPNLTADLVVTSVVPLTVKNRTGGVLFVTLDGPKTYYFTIVNVKAKFLVVPGRYRVKAISTACSGTFENNKNFRNGGNIVYYCDSQ